MITKKKPAGRASKLSVMKQAMTKQAATKQAATKKAATKKAATQRVERTASRQAGARNGETASQQISARITELGDWRGDVLRHVRKLIHDADPAITEEWKWQKATSPGVPVWSHGGGVCTGESYKAVVKLTFFKGAALRDPHRLFNSSLDGNVRRAIDIREDDEIDEAAFKDLIRAAVALNLSARKK